MMAVPECYNGTGSTTIIMLSLMFLRDAELPAKSHSCAFRGIFFSPVFFFSSVNSYWLFISTSFIYCKIKLVFISLKINSSVLVCHQFSMYQIVSTNTE